MRIVRLLVRTLVALLTLVLTVGAVGVIVSQTAWFRSRLRGYLANQADRYLNGTVSIGRLSGSLFFDIELGNVGVSMHGRQIAAVKDLSLDYNVFALLTRGLSFDRIQIDRPVVHLWREGGAWSITRLVRPQRPEPSRTGPGRPIAIAAIGVNDGSIVVDGPVRTSGIEVPRRFDHFDALLSFHDDPLGYSVEIEQASLRGSDPAITLDDLSGSMVVRNDTMRVRNLAIRTAASSVRINGALQQYLTRSILHVQIDSDALALPEVARLVPALTGVRLEPAFQRSTFALSA